ncbi:MAG: large subunit ribosomal protein [Nocardioidaceae bacterium]|nr:large subunit ribosomal protein [Nocardioidaceae bacterium]
MASPDKTAAVAELADRFRESSGAVLTDYRGLTVKQLQELRRSLGEDVSYAVAKNTLTKIAAKDAGVELDEALLVGPTAIAFIKGDVVEAAKGLRDFAKANAPLIIKGGFLDGNVLTAAEVNKLADLESREVLLAKLAGGMKASITNAASLFNAPLSQAARVLGALQAKAVSDPSILAAGPEAAAPAAEAPASDDAVAEPVAETTAEAPAAASDVEATPEAEAPAEAAPVEASTDATAQEAASDDAVTEG